MTSNLVPKSVIYRREPKATPETVGAESDHSFFVHRHAPFFFFVNFTINNAIIYKYFAKSSL